MTTPRRPQSSPADGGALVVIFHHIAWQGIHEKEGLREPMDSRSGFENDERHEPADKSLAVVRAGAGTVAWAAARDAHREAGSADHEDFYGLTAELVATLGPIGSLMRQMSTQVAGYADSVPPGRRVYDDARSENPRELLERAAQVLDQLSLTVNAMTLELSVVWSLIGRIGVENAPDGPVDNGPDGARDATDDGGAGVSS